MVDSEGELDILTVAMASGAFSDEDLVDQMMTFLVAGTPPTLPGPGPLDRFFCFSN